MSYDKFLNLGGLYEYIKIFKTGVFPPFWKYEDEADLLRLSRKMWELIKTKELIAFEEISVSPAIRVTEDMDRIYFNSHKEFAEKFMKENAIANTELSDENINQWFEIIDQRFEVLLKMPFEEATGGLMEIGCFLAEMLYNANGGTWKTRKSSNGKFKCKLVIANINTSFVGHREMVFSYKDKDLNYSKKYFLETVETIRNYQKEKEAN